MANGFGFERPEKHNEYLGTWVQINPVGNKPSYFGKLERIDEEGYAILRPHLSSVYHEKRGAVKGITRKPARIDLANADILPKTERIIRAMARHNNLRNKLEKNS